MSRKKRRVPSAPEPAAPSEAPRKVPRALVEIGDFNQPPLPVAASGGERPPAAASSAREAVPPPSDWVWPREGERIEVEVLRDGDRIARWITATVASVLADGWFSALIRVTSGAQHDEWTDWFTWLEEGKDWRRAGRALEKGWDAATVQRKLTALRGRQAGAEAADASEQARQQA